MIINLYAVYDEKAQAFMSPFQNTNDGMAIRSFIQACQNPEVPFSKYPLDYTLFRVGKYDDEKAVFTNEEPKAQQLLTASDAIRMHKQDQQTLRTLHEEPLTEAQEYLQETKPNGEDKLSVV